MLFFANVYMLYYKVYPNLGQGLTLSLYKFILTETRAFPHSRGVIGGHKGKKEEKRRILGHLLQYRRLDVS